MVIDQFPSPPRPQFGCGQVRCDHRKKEVRKAGRKNNDIRVGRERKRSRERGGVVAVGGGYIQDQSTSAEWALAPSCDLWPASAPKAQILLTIASCSTWITLVFKHQQAQPRATGDVADTRETRDEQERGTRTCQREVGKEKGQGREWGGREIRERHGGEGAEREVGGEK